MDGSENTPPGIGTFLEKFNLPKLIAGPAGQAISRLVGASVDIPAAKLEQFSQAIRDKTAAKSKVASALADTVSAGLANDLDLIDRATQSLLTKELRRQDNREKIAAKAIEYLNEPTDGNETVTPVEDDWLNVFERYAGDASTERLQDLWARVLAGEIRAPRSFSLKALRFISELDSSIANTFEKYASKVVYGGFIPLNNADLFGDTVDDLLLLQEFGLISDITSNLHNEIEFDTPTHAITYRDKAIILRRDDKPRDKPVKLSLPCIPLTKVGREIHNILSPAFDIDNAKAVVDLIPKSGLANIQLGDLVKDKNGRDGYKITQTLWSVVP